MSSNKKPKKGLSRKEQAKLNWKIERKLKRG
jgi:hypothetical protein